MGIELLNGKVACLHYKCLNAQLQGRNYHSRKLTNNTYAIRHTDGRITIRLHDTDIIIYSPNGSMCLTSGGYRTKLTKDRLNMFSPFRITQRDSLWMLYLPDGSVTVFFDGITFTRGLNLSARQRSMPKAEIERVERINKLIQQYCAALKVMPELPMPSDGDCWVCRAGNTTCLMGHLGECYIHGTLIVRALIDNGYSPKSVYSVAKYAGKQLIISAVRRYFKRHLGIPR